MWFEADDFHFFWQSRWFHPLRAASPYLSDPMRQRADKGLKVPRWLRPIYLQRWIGQAVAARAAWLAAHPAARPYRYADSEPCWMKTAALPYEKQQLRRLTGKDLWWLLDVNLERLLRIMQADPDEIGRDRWTQAILGTCGHLIQAYRELKRRVGTRKARALLREELWLFVTFGTSEVEAEEDARADAPPAVPVPAAAAFPIPANALPVALVE